MIQLIPQSKIDKVAEDYVINKFDNPDIDLSDGVKFGVEFTLNEIHPLIIEFKEFCDKYELYGEKYSPVTKNTQQLLEEFIKSKNK